MCSTYPKLIFECRFIFGLLLFVTGMAINIHSDYTLIGLRKDGEKGYKVPHGQLLYFRNTFSTAMVSVMEISEHGVSSLKIKIRCGI